MALSEIEKLERRYAENPHGLTFAPLAEVHRKNGDVQRALELLKPGLQSHPDYIPASIVLGRCHLDLGDLPVGRDGVHPRARPRRGERHRAQGAGGHQRAAAPVRRRRALAQHPAVAGPEQRRGAGPARPARGGSAQASAVEARAPVAEGRSRPRRVDGAGSRRAGPGRGRAGRRGRARWTWNWSRDGRTGDRQRAGPAAGRGGIVLRAAEPGARRLEELSSAGGVDADAPPPPAWSPRSLQPDEPTGRARGADSAGLVGPGWWTGG